MIDALLVGRIGTTRRWCALYWLGRLRGLLFDIEENGLWWAEWGNRPNAAEERTEVLTQVLSHAPKLIPIFGHRYLPATPSQAGNPVFSVYQSDVIHYGADLADYLDREENGWEAQPWPEVREIDFWSELVRRNVP